MSSIVTLLQPYRMNNSAAPARIRSLTSKAIRKIVVYKTPETLGDFKVSGVSFVLSRQKAIMKRPKNGVKGNG
jgi:hypothetical protein